MLRSLRQGLSRRAGWVLLTSCLLTCAAWTIYAVHAHRQNMAQTLDRESNLLNRLISQRADQHDAHLTSLSTLASTGPGLPLALLHEMAAAIQNFYPRISAIDIVDRTAQAPGFSTRAAVDSRTDRLQAQIRQAAARSDGERMIIIPDNAVQRYLLVKRSPNTDAYRYAIALEINIKALVQSDADYWREPRTTIELDASRSLAATLPPTSNPLTRPLRYENRLSSQSQGLFLRTTRRITMAQALPLTQVLSGVGLAVSASLALTIALALLMRTRRAEWRARLSEQDARIAHASRVNTLGEMASGLAHELTQPLTAILSQSQAGIRLLHQQSADPTALTPALDAVLAANVAQARRAADILTRLRNWSRPADGQIGAHRLNERVANVVSLLEADARRHQIDVQFTPDPAEPSVSCDDVELEQIIFNLVRNAFDAIMRQPHGSPSGRVLMVVATKPQHCTLTITDNGPGIDPNIAKRLFEPFVTGRPDGMGLGLALSLRLSERMGGTLTIANATSGGASAILKLPLTPSQDR